MPDLNLQRRRLYWKMTVTRGGCIMCAAAGGDLVAEVPIEVRDDRRLDLQTIQGHHVLEQQQLKRHGYEPFTWDERNGVGVCLYHHQRHTHWRERIPRELLPVEAFEFADEIDLGWLIDREYA